MAWQDVPLLSPQVQIKEETRLVSIIDQIDKAVAILPRGALFKTPFGVTHVNRTFEGEFLRILSEQEVLRFWWTCLGNQGICPPWRSGYVHGIPPGGWASWPAAAVSILILFSCCEQCPDRK